jgi:hypothetical protein
VHSLDNPLAKHRGLKLVEVVPPLGCFGDPWVARVRPLVKTPHYGAGGAAYGCRSLLGIIIVGPLPVPWFRVKTHVRLGPTTVALRVVTLLGALS